MPEKNINIDELARVFAGGDDREEMKDFFEEIFTPSEVRDFALRWELMKMLRQGVTQREIGAALGISLCKITRGAKLVKDTGSVTRKLLDKQSRCN